MELDLQKYCSEEQTEPHRDYLWTPFSSGDFTYATNGHIMVRVPRIEGVREQKEMGGWDKPLKGSDTASFGRFDHGAIPQVPGPCVHCSGRGTVHDCPDCTCTCEGCNGRGRPKISTKVRGRIFDLRYIAMMLELPNVVVQRDGQGEDPLQFKFDGGIGAVMPMRGECAEHIEIEIAAAA